MHVLREHGRYPLGSPGTVSTLRMPEFTLAKVASCVSALARSVCHSKRARGRRHTFM